MYGESWVGGWSGSSREKRGGLGGVCVYLSDVAGEGDPERPVELDTLGVQHVPQRALLAVLPDQRHVAGLEARAHQLAHVDVLQGAGLGKEK